MSPRYKEKPYVLVDRALSSGKHVFYYYTYKDGKRTNLISTGAGYTKKKDAAKKRREAENYCMELFKHDRLGARKSTPTLSKWVGRKHFWNWRKSDYIRGKLARSDSNRPGITETYTKTGEQVTRDHILPFHGHKYIDEITAADCEDLLFRWTDNGASYKSANNWRSIYSVMLGEAERLGEIKNNPWKLVSELSPKKNSYGALTIAEVARIISPEFVNFDKMRDRIYYYAAKLSFVTGMRIGEICGLLAKDVRDVYVEKDGKEIRGSYLDISMQYNVKLKKRTPVKDKDSRKIPISAELRDELETFLQYGNDSFVFSFHPKQKTPISPHNLRNWLYGRMEQVGIKGRKDRNITFHSTRRFFNTLLRHERIADDVIRRFTGHDSEEMTDHYTDYLPEDLEAISKAQKRLLLGEIKE